MHKILGTIKSVSYDVYFGFYIDDIKYDKL